MRVMNVGERIRKARKDAKLSQPELAQRCGWKSQSRISQYELNKRYPSYNDLRLIGRALGKHPSWFLGDSESESFTNDEPMYKVADEARPIKTTVPLISWVQAGQWAEIIDNYAPGDGEEQVSVDGDVGPRSFALRVHGDSMEREFPEGVTIVVDPDFEPRNGSYVIARLNDELEATFKQLVFDGGRVYLKPLNERYPIIEADENMTICGVVRRLSKKYE